MSLSLAEDREVIRPSVETRRWSHRTTALLLSVLVLSSIVIVRGIHAGEFSYNVDETQHAVTGLFAADLIRDHPLAHPVQYTYLYYAQYPALAGVIHWPPLFYFFEGLSFLFLGPTVVAARLSILAFSLLGLTFWFLLVRELQSDWMAAAAVLMLAFLPSVLLFEKSVMLEIPCLALSLGATYFWIRYLLYERPRDLYWVALACSAALLTKQNAIYLLPFCLLSGLIMRGRRVFFHAQMLRALTIFIVLTAPFYTLVYLVHWKTIAMDLGENRASGGHRVLFYWNALPKHLGWTVLLLGILGILTSRWWDKPRVTAVMLSWILACYATFTLIGHQEARYALYWVPPFLYFALGLLTCYFRKPLSRTCGRAAAVVLVGAQLASAWSFQRPYVSGYAQAAKRVTEASRSGIILFDGELPGNFIFFVRANDPRRSFLVLRKALYATRLKRSGGAEELIHSREEIEQIIRSYGVRYVVISEGGLLRFESQKILRELLVAPRFRELGRFRIEGTDSQSPNSSLVVFENTVWAAPTAKFLQIKMMTLNHDIVVPMDKFMLDDGIKSAPSSGKQGAADAK